MSETGHLELPLLAASQSQKHVTVNEALVLLDALVQLAVVSRTLTAPPASPIQGERYLVAATATGAWAGHDGDVAFYQDGTWRYAVPNAGWRLWSLAENALIAFDGIAWRDLGEIAELQELSLLGVNTSADAANRLAVSSANVLFSHAGSDHRLKLNKQAAGDTAALLLQDSFSGRAELGLAGDDDLHLKVSADGAAWSEAMVVDRASGAVSLPASASTPQLTMAVGAAPAAPAAGRIIAFALDAGRPLLAQCGPAGLATPFQPFLGQRRVSHWMAHGGNLGITLNGAGSTVAIGTATTRTPASTRMFTSLRRIGHVSATTAGSSCGVLTHNSLVFWRGNAAGLGGFHALFTFGVSDAAAVADARLFVGLQASSTAIGNVNPSTLVNAVGVACDAGETTLRITTNDTAGAASRIDLSADFPSQTLSTDWYELVLYAPPNAAAISWRVSRRNTGHVASGELTADLPLATAFLAPQLWRNNGATALAVAIDVASVYVETDY